MTSAHTRPKRPNILLITTHDTGRHFGCYGYETLHTPNIDRFASEGVRFTNYHAVVPICSASRATMLTGQYPQTHGLMDLTTPVVGWRLRDPRRHLSHVLRGAGYHTRLFGIQHEAADVSTLGFDSIDDAPSNRWHRGAALHVAERVAGFLASDAAEKNPFYAQIGFFETHTPFETPDAQPDESCGVQVPPYVADDESARRTMAEFQGSVRVVDEAVGTIIDALERSGATRDTLVIVTTDHGIELPRAKWHLYDPGTAIAMIARWPGGGLTGSETCDRLMSNVDFLPTLLDLIGVPVPDGVDGLSFAQGLRDPGAPPPRDALFGLYHKAATRSVRTERYKLIQHFDFPTDFAALPVVFDDVLAKRVCDMTELFDLDADPHEFTSVSGDPQYADALAKLSGRLWEWLEVVDDPILRGPVPSPAYELAQTEYRKWLEGRE